MGVYFLLLCFIVVSGLCFKPYNAERARQYCALIFGLLGFLIAFRSGSVGNDTAAYIDYFERVRRINSLGAISSIDSRFEPGFFLLNFWLSRISNNPQVILLFSGLFVAYSFGRFIFKYSNYPMLSVVMFFTLGYFDLSLSGVRQILAISVLLFSYSFIVKRKPLFFLFVVVFASSFHFDALGFLLLYPLYLLRLYSKHYLLICIIASAVILYAFQYVIGLIDNYLPGYIRYFTNESEVYSTSANLATTLMILLWSIMFLFIRSYKDISYLGYVAEGEQSAEVKGKYTVYSASVDLVHEVAVLLALLMLVMSTNATILNRYRLVFSVSLLVLFPNAMTKRRMPIVVVISIFVFFLYGLIIYLYRPEWQSTYPYSFCW